ncbi:MAG: acyl-CoA dehydrogenase family protein, partial [Pseudomonadota bacterium]
MDGMTDIPSSPVLNGLTDLLRDAVTATDRYKSALHAKICAKLAPGGQVDRSTFASQQHLAHGYAWIVTYMETLRETANWATRLEASQQFGEIDALLVQILFSRYLADLVGGVPMNQGEVIRPHEMDALTEVGVLFDTPAVRTLIEDGLTPETMAAAAAHLPHALSRATVETTGEDETLAMIRDQFRRYSDDKIAPHAHAWHLNNEYIPMTVVGEMAELGVFGLTIPERYDGLGMGKTAMCVVSEELSRGYIGAGSLGTRSEIAAELILIGGTQAQKETYLPSIARGEILPTAVFTEPNTGSDLGALRTRAVKTGAVYKITGNKTWITHPVRADLMTLLARTDPETTDFSGLSMFLAEKPRGSDADPFPTSGLTGGEIEVLGYRG